VVWLVALVSYEYSIRGKANQEPHTYLVAAGDGVAPHSARGRPAEAPDGAGAEHVRLRDPPDGHGPLRARLPGRRPQLDAGVRGGVIAGAAAAAAVSLGPRRRVRQWPLPAQPRVVEGRLQVRRNAVDEVAVGALRTDTPTTKEERSLSVPSLQIMHAKKKRDEQEEERCTHVPGWSGAPAC